jgi:hypothetical protein
MKLLPVVCRLLFSAQFYLFAQLPAFAQNNALKKENISKVLFKGNYFSLHLSSFIAQRARCINQSGNYPLSASKSSGIETGGNYFINFNENYSLIAGAHAGFSGRNFELLISKTEFNPHLENDINFHGKLTMDYELYLSVPVWLEKRWIKQNNSTWNVDVGINLRLDPDEAFYKYDYHGIDINGQDVPVLLLTGWSGTDNKPWFDVNFAGGYSVFLSNYNFLRFNLVGNLSATKIVNFNYTIDVTGKPKSTGTYSTNLSYIGLSVNYILTGSNKRLLRLYEGMSK